MTSSVLGRPTLVLNRNWQPVAVSTVSRALTKVWNETARIVDPSNYQLYGWEEWAVRLTEILSSELSGSRCEFPKSSR